MSVRLRRSAALISVTALALAATTQATTAANGAAGTTSARTSSTAAAAAAAPFRTLFEARGPRGLDVAPGGALVVSRTNGSYGRILRGGGQSGTFQRLGRVPRGFLAPALDVNANGDVLVLTVGGPRAAEGAGTLYRWTADGGQQELADIQAYQRRDPDPDDLENRPRETNPYGVAALDDGGALVADAAGNDLLHVHPDGTIETVARFKPRVVRVPRGLGENAPPAGTPMPSESVPTSVTVGADGFYYVGELRGFPATPRTSQIWRIRPGVTNATCDPETPHRGPCKRYVRNMTSVVGLQAGEGGSMYVVELAKKGWLKAESGDPAAAIGRVVRIGHDRGVRTELGRNRLVLPGDVAVGGGGAVMVTTPIFGPGRVVRIR